MQRKAILYARVSTDEQALKGFSVAEQLYALREYAEREDLEVVEEVVDEGYSGASPERPGLMRVMELAESGKVEMVVATKRDRLFRSRLYRLLAERDLAEYGALLVALNDTGNRLADSFQDEFAEYEREQITSRTMAGKLQKAREGKVIAGRLPVYGFRYTPDRDHYEVDEAKMSAVRRLFALVASGVSVAATARALTEEGFPAPGGAGRLWQRPTVREIVLDDSYRPHSRQEIEPLLSPAVAASLDDSLRYGVWWYNRREVVTTRRGTRVRKKSRSEWIAVPVPDAGVPLNVVEAARRAVIGNEKTSSRARREWELSGGILRCGECSCALVSHTNTHRYQKKDGTTTKRVRYYYRCATYRRLGREGCPMSRNLHAANTEALVWGAVRSAVLSPERLRKALAARRARKNTRRERGRLEAILARLTELEKRRDALIDLTLDGPLSKAELSERLVPLDTQIKALKKEAEVLRHEEAEAQATEEDERLMLRRLEAGMPEDLDALTPEQRRELYRRLGLKANVASSDGSITLTWFVDAELGVIRCQEEGT